ncbi:hypothetical protein COLO4_32116 [Corchorus olitorius]|uniref:Uncharacterized protein n=1 Tax=Corchorus olitorius TaxID=93759 RepID=A0A1R3H157_9ROSI|nr:hypothetical protein COLO4_32116 [Corchorus olitorius]
MACVGRLLSWHGLPFKLANMAVANSTKAMVNLSRCLGNALK